MLTTPISLPARGGISHATIHLMTGERVEADDPESGRRAGTLISMRRLCDGGTPASVHPITNPTPVSVTCLRCRARLGLWAKR